MMEVFKASKSKELSIVVRWSMKAGAGRALDAGKKISGASVCGVWSGLRGNCST